MEAGTSVLVESSVKYRSSWAGILTDGRDSASGQRQAGGLTGAVAS